MPHRPPKELGVARWTFRQKTAFAAFALLLGTGMIWALTLA